MDDKQHNKKKATALTFRNDHLYTSLVKTSLFVISSSSHDGREELIDSLRMSSFLRIV